MEGNIHSLSFVWSTSLSLSSLINREEEPKDVALGRESLEHSTAFCLKPLF